MRINETVEVTLFLRIDNPNLKAIGFSETENNETIIWLPRSQIEIEKIKSNKEVYTVILPIWLAEKTGLI